MNTSTLVSLAFWIGAAYVIVRGALGCLYDIVNWAIDKLERPDKSSQDDKENADE